MKPTAQPPSLPPDLKVELETRLAECKSIMAELDACLGDIVAAECDVRRELQRLPQFGLWRIRALNAWRQAQFALSHNLARTPRLSPRFH